MTGGERSSSTHRNDDSKGPTKPDLFFGDRAKLEDWFNQLGLYFMYNNVGNPNKSLFAASHCRGRAQHYLKPLLSAYVADKTERVSSVAYPSVWG